jgi:hypothetical protein
VWTVWYRTTLFRDEKYYCPVVLFAYKSSILVGGDSSVKEGALSLAYMYISLTSGRLDPSSFNFKTPAQITTSRLFENI